MIEVAQSIRYAGIETVGDVRNGLLHGYLLSNVKVIVILELRCRYTFAAFVRAFNKVGSRGCGRSRREVAGAVFTVRACLITSCHFILDCERAVTVFGMVDLDMQEHLVVVALFVAAEWASKYYA